MLQGNDATANQQFCIQVVQLALQAGERELCRLIDGSKTSDVALSLPSDCSLLCTSAMMACSARWQPSSRYLHITSHHSTARMSCTQLK
jgi:hypothetical protein